MNRRSVFSFGRSTSVKNVKQGPPDGTKSISSERALNAENVSTDTLVDEKQLNDKFIDPRLTTSNIEPKKLPDLKPGFTFSSATPAVRDMGSTSSESSVKKSVSFDPSVPPPAIANPASLMSGNSKDVAPSKAPEARNDFSAFGKSSTSLAERAPRRAKPADDEFDLWESEGVPEPEDSEQPLRRFGDPPVKEPERKVEPAPAPEPVIRARGAFYTPPDDVASMAMKKLGDRSTEYGQPPVAAYEETTFDKPPPLRLPYRGAFHSRSPPSGLIKPPEPVQQIQPAPIVEKPKSPSPLEESKNAMANGGQGRDGRGAGAGGKVVPRSSDAFAKTPSRLASTADDFDEWKMEEEEERRSKRVPATSASKREAPKSSGNWDNIIPQNEVSNAAKDPQQNSGEQFSCREEELDILRASLNSCQTEMTQQRLRHDATLAATCAEMLAAKRKMIKQQRLVIQLSEKLVAFGSEGLEALKELGIIPKPANRSDEGKDRDLNVSIDYSDI